MKAKHKIFGMDDYSGDEAFLQAVEKFITELGPNRFIQICERFNNAYCVWYWEGESQETKITNDINRGSKIRCGVKTPQPVLITPQPAPPGTLMCRQDEHDLIIGSRCG